MPSCQLWARRIQEIGWKQKNNCLWIRYLQSCNIFPNAKCCANDTIVNPITPNCIYIDLDYTTITPGKLSWKQDRIESRWFNFYHPCLLDKAKRFDMSSTEYIVKMLLNVTYSSSINSIFASSSWHLFRRVTAVTNSHFNTIIIARDLMKRICQQHEHRPTADHRRDHDPFILTF